MNRLCRPLLLPIVLSLPVAAQLPQPGSSGVATEVVVTAGAVPEAAGTLGVATDFGEDPAFGFLAKPFTEHALSGKIREVLDAPPP